MSDMRSLFVVTGVLSVALWSPVSWADKSKMDVDMTPYLIKTPPPGGILAEPVNAPPKEDLAPIKADLPKTTRPDLVKPPTTTHTRAKSIDPDKAASIKKNIPSGSAAPSKSPVVPSSPAEQSITQQHGDMLRDSQRARQLQELKEMNDLMQKEAIKGYAVDPMRRPGDTGGRPPIGSLPNQGGPGGPERAFTDPYTAKRGDQGKPGKMIGPSSGDLKGIMKGSNRDAGAPFHEVNTTISTPNGTVTQHMHENRSETVTSQTVDNVHGDGTTTKTVNVQHLDGTVTVETTVSEGDNPAVTVTERYDSEGNLIEQRDGPSRGVDELQGTESGGNGNVCATMPWLKECNSQRKNPNPGANPGTAANAGQPVGARLKVNTDDLLVNPSPTDIRAQGQPKYTAPGQIGTGPGAKPLPPGGGDVPGKN